MYHILIRAIILLFLLRELISLILEEDLSNYLALPWENKVHFKINFCFLVLFSSILFSHVT